ncbi:MAG: hypothetical protein P5702_11870 [Limnospira sp. PMC 1291.21]|uniref:Uncharacterized protein n=1 Tax=Limnospira maxima CS-328 TaxID=513049 RepID=B5VUV4_LIMMA|nr:MULTISPECIES: DUF3226 domain-containing protein [Limnospira]MDC0837145.1 hypothetical protein [Limnoraphis robusta]EDZ96799.1 conserved hypothetical protein [Limnospira maxima CS-328]MDT9178175.1 hypothetical protein [Limnospira sp. PMC 1238.20]MDT9191908.1 hypothetical protein [Limnospira sp. PMC 1245.20]MDT9202126.1 hypothetical protein [Limnospira sp. PMC 1243.20]
MRKPIRIDKPKLIIGEGIEEKIVFSRLIKSLKIEDIQVESYEGKGNLGKFLKSLHLIPGYQQLQSLGITRDADESFKSASESIDNFISNSNFSAAGTVKITQFIMPDNGSPGMLEDLCLKSIAANEIQCVDDFLECIYNRCERTPKNLAKAKIHAWLASQVNPGKRLGEAVESGYIKLEDEAFQQIIEFIKNI